MTEPREHYVILRKSPNETVVEAVCGRCQYKMATPEDYHPESFCVLVEHKFDPIEEVNKARKRIEDRKVTPLRKAENE